jgi:chorismate mutase/prephenate dehydratase
VGSEFENSARLFFSTLFAISKARQREIINGVSPLSASIERAMNEYSSSFPTRAVVACAGTEGSYAQQAASLMFKIPSIVFFNDFEKVFEAVDRGLCPYGILPIENSSAGSVVSVYDLMQRYNFNIVRSIRLKVDHVLLAPSGVKLEDIKEVASHPHALAQCSGFFKSHPQIKAVPASNTAVAAKEISSGKRIDTAVIASRACAELYGLSILADGIADAAFNYTRFICLSKKLEIYPDANKFSIMLSIPHRPGALNSIISKFAAIDVNITKLESRPVPGMDFEFRFIFDFEASPTAPGVTALLSELSLDPEIDHFVFLGAYSEK